MKRKEGYIVSVEDFQVPFDLRTYAEDLKTVNQFGIAYFKEDVIGSGFDDFVFYGVGKLTVNKFIKELIKLGVPTDQIHTNAITRIS